MVKKHDIGLMWSPNVEVITRRGAELNSDASRPAPSAGCCMGLGCVAACTPHRPLGRGLVTPSTVPPTGQAALGKAGTRPTIAGTRSAGPLGPSTGAEAGGRPTETRGSRLGRPDENQAIRGERLARSTGPREQAGAQPAAPGWEEVLPKERGGRQKFPHPGPIRGPLDCPHHGNDGSTPRRSSPAIET